MKTMFIVTRKIAVDGMVAEMKGSVLDIGEALFAIRQLEKNYSREAGWRLLDWIDNRRGKMLVDFEMTAERELEGHMEVVQFSMARQQEPVRRYR